MSFDDDDNNFEESYYQDSDDEYDSSENYDDFEEYIDYYELLTPENKIIINNYINEKRIHEINTVFNCYFPKEIQQFFETEIDSELFYKFLYENKDFQQFYENLVHVKIQL
jgi:hypothetical protein